MLTLSQNVIDSEFRLLLRAALERLIHLQELLREALLPDVVIGLNLHLKGTIATRNRATLAHAPVGFLLSPKSGVL
jgi:hypothetical protein